MQRPLAVVLALSIAVAACGLRTPVRPPEDTAPVIPGTPTVTREVDVTVVRWKRAVRSADDMRLDDLTSFVVERKKSGSEAWEPVATIDVVDQEKIRRRGSFSWRDADASARDASYRVIAVTADGQQGPANEAVAAPTGAGNEAATAPARPANDESAAPTSPANEESATPASPANAESATPATPANETTGDPTGPASD